VRSKAPALLIGGRVHRSDNSELVIEAYDAQGTFFAERADRRGCDCLSGSYCVTSGLELFRGFTTRQR
jgi:hypothetical protein